MRDGRESATMRPTGVSGGSTKGDDFCPSRCLGRCQKLPDGTPDIGGKSVVGSPWYTVCPRSRYGEYFWEVWEQRKDQSLWQRYREGERRGGVGIYHRCNGRKSFREVKRVLRFTL